MTSSRRVLLILSLVVSWGALLCAQTSLPTKSSTSPATAPTTNPTTQAAPTTVPASQPTTQAAIPPVALAAFNADLESDTATVRSIQANLTPEALNPPMAEQLVQLRSEIDSRIEEDRLTLYSHPDPESLRAMGQIWQNWQETLTDTKKDLTAQASRLDGNVQKLADLAKAWWDRTSQARSSEAPPEIIQRAQGLLDNIYRTREAAEKGRSAVINLQNGASEQLDRVNDMLGSIKAARDAVVSRLMQRDALPIWSAAPDAHATQTILTSSQTSLAGQWYALRTYVQLHQSTFVAHAALMGLLIFVLIWTRRQVAAWIKEEPNLASSFAVFSHPVAAGVLLGLIGSMAVYPQAPHLLWAILGTAMMVPTIYLLRQLVDRKYFPIVNAMAIFYAIDQLRGVIASQKELSRYVFLVEMLAGVLFLLWRIKARRLVSVIDSNGDRLETALRIALRLAGILFLAAATVNAFGYVGLGNLLGRATLASGYVAMILYMVARIIDGLIGGAVRLWPLNTLNFVQHHRDLVYRRVGLAVRWIIFAWWLYIALDLFAIRELVFDRGWRIITTTATWGPISLSLLSVFQFCVTLWAAFALSRLVRFLLEEDVYPRVGLARGLPYAVSTMLHYAILLIGFFTAVGALGYDLTKFTILAGAFGVGLGFGLQNIVNNFVSGIILLFERPVKVGDVVEIDNLQGVVTRIGIRASFIRTHAGADLIVPNARFISERVTNWTFSTRQRGIQLPVSVAAGTDTQRVMDLLVKTAIDHPQVVDEPSPQVLITGFNATSISFELQGWTGRFEDSVAVRSDLAKQIIAMLKKEEIELR